MIRIYNTLTKAAKTIEADRLYVADAFNVLPLCEDESFDLIICDGPYGVTANDWDQVGSVQEFNLNLIKTFSQKLKPGGTLYLFGKPNCIDFIDTLVKNALWCRIFRHTIAFVCYLSAK